MDADVKSFYVALGYNSAILVVSLIAWLTIVRPIRCDAFRPNARTLCVSRFQSELEETGGRALCGVLPASSWMIKVWRWDIDNFSSTDIYLYLLFHRTTATLLFLTSVLSLGVGFPVIWTAHEADDVGLRRRTFFERSVITNIPSHDNKRLWVIYALVYGVASIGVVTAFRFYSAVRSDEFRSAVLASTRRKKAANRFMPNKHTVTIQGIDRSELSTTNIREQLLHFFEPNEIVAIHLVMDYSEALEAHRAFQKYLSKLQHVQDRQKREQEAADNAIIVNVINEDGESAPPPISGVYHPSPERRSRWRMWPSFRTGSAFFSARSMVKFDDSMTPFLTDATRPTCSDTPSDSTFSEEGDEEEDSTPQVHFSPSLTPDHRRPRHMSESRVSTIWEDTSRSLLPENLQSRLDEIEASPIQRKSRFRSSPKNAVTHLEERVLTQFSLINRLKSKAPTRSTGRAFVSFAHQEAAKFALTHDFNDPRCPVFRKPPVLGHVLCASCGVDMNDEFCICSRWNSDWKVKLAPPPQDIVWENMHVRRYSRLLRRWLSTLFIFVLSLIFTSSAMATDALVPFAQQVENLIERVSFFKISVSGFVAPTILYLINALLLPFLVSWGANVSRFWRHSARERAVMLSNTGFMTLSSLVFPILGTTSVQAVISLVYQTKIGDLFTYIGVRVAGASGSFMARYLLNATFINSSTQLLQIPMFSQQRIMAGLGKKPKKWAFDFGYWYAFHLSVIAVCTTLAVDVPLVPVLGCIFFTAKYWVDKYNFTFYVWKVGGESAGEVAASAVTFIFFFQALFLFAMSGYFVTVGIHAESVQQEGEYEKGPRRLFVGGIILLVMCLLLLLLTFGEKAQRSIVRSHAGSLRRLGQWFYALAARGLARWGVVQPVRRVKEVECAEELSENQMETLLTAYQHPYECPCNGRHQ